MAVEPLIGGTDRGEIEQYSSISGVAVLALLVGLLSFTALTHPVLWCLPPLAVVLALAALYRIRHSDGALSGRGIAVLALGLACCAASLAVSRSVIARELQRRQATAFADRWFDAISGEQVRLAHQWTISKLMRAGRSQSLQEAYEGEENREALQKFMSDGPSRALIELAPDATFEYVRTRSIAGDTKRVYFSLDYKVNAPGSKYDGQEFGIVVLRRHDSELGIDWWQISQVGEIDSDEAGSSEGADLSHPHSAEMH